MALRLDEIGRHLDMSESNASTVSRMLRIDRETATLDDVRVAYIRDLREKAAGRGGDGQAELVAARIRESKAKAIGFEVQNLERMGALIPVDELEPALEQWATVARAEVANALSKIIADIQGNYGIDIEQSIVDTHIRNAYSIIGRYPGRDPLSDQSGADGVIDADWSEMDTAAE